MSVLFNGSAFNCTNTHSLICEDPVSIQTRDFFSWGQKGQVQIYGGQSGRELYVYCWLHHPELSSVQLMDNYLLTLDKRTGEFGTLVVTTGQNVMRRQNCRFMGFERQAFSGQEHPGIIPVIGPDIATYGAFHIPGVLRFRQLRVTDSQGV